MSKSTIIDGIKKDLQHFFPSMDKDALEAQAMMVFNRMTAEEKKNYKRLTK